ncbi:hypothetical protein PG167_001432 [Campylobacter jejuni]|nr:hypothetical protein [Campylobacter jejuni]
MHTLVLMFFLFSFYTQEKSSGVDFKQGAEFTSIMMVSEFPIGELKEVSIDQKCRRKNKISIWKNKTSIKVEILFFYKP